MASSKSLAGARFQLFYLGLLLLCDASRAAFHCNAGEWWNSMSNGRCVPCSLCSEAVLRTCQPHKDTVCGSYADIKMNIMEAKSDDEGASNALGEIHWAWEWSETLLIVAAITSGVFVIAFLYLMIAHRRQWRKMERLDEELENDISRLMVKLAQVPNVERTTAVLVDEQQLKRHSQKSGIPFRCIYLDQLLGKSPQRKGYANKGNVYTEASSSKFAVWNR